MPAPGASTDRCPAASPRPQPRTYVTKYQLRSDDVLHCLTDLIVAHGTPEHMRSDNGPEFVARNVREWLGRIGVKTLFIEPGSPWENGYCETFNSKLRDELLRHYGARAPNRIKHLITCGSLMATLI
jgi:transposase InsO family protein